MTTATLRVVWATNADLASIPDDDLSPREIERASRYRSDLRRQQYTASRALLRALLAEHTGRPPDSFELLADERGKPFCTDGPAVSISHSSDIVTCAVCDAGDIGIDIEFPRRSRDVEAIARRYFCREEAEWVSGQPADRFYMLWVLKEAWLKATGTGIAGGLDKLRCLVAPPRIEALARSAPFTALRLYTLRGGFLGIAAVNEHPGTAEVRRWLPALGGFAADEELQLLAAGDPAR
jgi:phosphopantetheinyl transferase